MIPALLLPLLSKLAESGLSLIGNAVINKGKDYVEKELGVSLDDATKTEAGIIQLQQLQNDKEEILLAAAIENRKVDLDYYRIDAADRDSARQREVDIANSDSGWLAKNIVPILALIVVVGGGAGIIWSPDTDVRIGLASIVAVVVGYYFGTSKGMDRQNRAVQELAATGAAK